MTLCTKPALALAMSGTSCGKIVLMIVWGVGKGKEKEYESSRTECSILQQQQLLTAVVHTGNRGS